MTQSGKSVENPKQREAFLAYFNLEKRSLEKLRQHYTKILPKKAVCLETLKIWSSKFKWQERITAMDIETASKVEQLAIKEATMKQSDILKAVKDTMTYYNNALLRKQIIPTASDFKKMWEIQRAERGLDTGQPSPIKVEINQRILNIVDKAEEDTRKVIEAEIIGDKE